MDRPVHIPLADVNSQQKPRVTILPRNVTRPATPVKSSMDNPSRGSFDAIAELTERFSNIILRMENQMSEKPKKQTRFQSSDDKTLYNPHHSEYVRPEKDRYCYACNGRGHWMIDRIAKKVCPEIKPYLDLGKVCIFQDKLCDAEKRPIHKSKSIPRLIDEIKMRDENGTLVSKTVQSRLIHDSQTSESLSSEESSESEEETSSSDSSKDTEDDSDSSEDVIFLDKPEVDVLDSLSFERKINKRWTKTFDELSKKKNNPSLTIGISQPKSSEDEAESRLIAEVLEILKRKQNDDFSVEIPTPSKKRSKKSTEDVEEASTTKATKPSPKYRLQTDILTESTVKKSLFALLNSPSNLTTGEALAMSPGLVSSLKQKLKGKRVLQDEADTRLIQSVGGHLSKSETRASESLNIIQKSNVH